MVKKHIFVVGLDGFNLAMLKRLRGADRLVFHGLLYYDSVVHTERYDMQALLAEARHILAARDSPADAIVGYWDFPTSTMLPLLREAAGLPGPTLESVLRCEHKYWSRLEQSRAIPGHTPPYAAVDPFGEGVEQQPPLPYPFWLKPVRAHSSMLGFMVRNETDYRRALASTRAGIARLAEPFNLFWETAETPTDVRHIDGYHCIAEAVISRGRQCTLEGFMLDGECRIFGAVDSLREGVHNSSFSRYQYPSDLPADVLERMAEIAGRFLHQAGYEQSPFNIEFYYDETDDAIWVLEINARISKSHSPLFEWVDGAANHQVMVDVALGQAPDMPHRQGPYSLAAKYMLRRHSDGTVLSVPTPEEIRRIEDELPGVRVLIGVEPGMQLHHLLHQDSYSFELATIFVAGEDEADLEAKYRSCRERLVFRFADAVPVDAVATNT